MEDRPIQRKGLIESLRERLQEDILSGRYPAGSTLPPERELAARYHVTRTSLKHALIELRSRGLIAIRHGIGSIVEDFAVRAGADALQAIARREGGWDLDLLEDLLEARALVGGLFGRIAAERRTEGDLGRVDAALVEVQGARDAEALQLAENGFMRTVTEATQVRTFVFLANSITAVYAGTLEAFRGAFADTRFVQDAMRTIAGAVRARDAAAAERGMREYLEESGRRMVGLVKERRGLKSEGAPDEDA